MSVAGFAAAMLAGGASARADTVTAHLDSVDMTTFTITVVNSTGTHTETGGAGMFHWTGVAGNPSPLQGNFFSFCTDIKDYISIGGTYTYDLSPLGEAPKVNGSGSGTNEDLGGGMGADKANVLSLLFGQHLADVHDTATAGAFQAAIWEVVYDDYSSDLSKYDVLTLDPSDVKVGFKVNSPSGTLTTTANAWLQGLDINGPKLNLGAITSDTFQDQIVVIPVPLPAAAGAGLALLGCLVVKRNFHA
jgi:hypothetical protein